MDRAVERGELTGRPDARSLLVAATAAATVLAAAGGAFTDPHQQGES